MKKLDMADSPVIAITCLWSGVRLLYFVYAVYKLSEREVAA